MENIKTLEELILEQTRKIQESEKKMENAQDIRTCKVCGKDKKRIYAGKYNYKDKKWVDETGKQWMGRTCPDCNVVRSKHTMRKTREKNKTSVS